jgi:hypothetical protein
MPSETFTVVSGAILHETLIHRPSRHVVLKRFDLDIGHYGHDAVVLVASHFGIDFGHIDLC